ncbi:MAG: putative teichuronic acid biosynthesis glycosyltransferase TuaH [Dehalococcoidia bacterium]|nr:putative teichuronic acid biosynthesis glycosyltransferase TuaH [Chloroflexota bacterium]
MCNAWCYDFGKKAKKYIIPSYTLLEVGSRDVNGTLRDLLMDSVREYVGVDLFDGKGVDRVVSVLELNAIYSESTFDMVLSTEMLEHCFEWREALLQMLLVLKPGGILLITTRSPGFELHDYPADHWRFSKEDFEHVFSPIGEILEIENDMTLGWPCGIGIILRKICDNNALKEWRDWLDKFSVYAMQHEIKTSPKATRNNENEGIIFDQYSRYKASADLLTQAGLATGSSVLDVGSGPECLFGQFIPGATINYVDPLIQGRPQNGYISGNVFSAELDGRVFDYVTAVDVLEHVPPESRNVFLDRLASLSKKAILLGFPSAESCDALAIDKAVDQQYRTIFGRDYSWLEEHHRFGLPSLTETVEHLGQLGWYCQTIGHGHAPWLQELLAFVVCTWEIPDLKHIVLEASENFNRTLYPSDFKEPHYRQFVIASRELLPAITLPVGENIDLEAESLFRKLMDETLHKYFVVSLRKLIENDAALVMRDAAVAERDAAVAERDAAVAERDAAVAEGDAAVAERDAVSTLIKTIKNSASWRLTQPLRFVARLVRYGLTNQDRQQMTQALRHHYHSLPLPAAVKNMARFAYRRMYRKIVRSIAHRSLRYTQFHAPEIRPLAQKDDKPDYFVWGVIDWYFRHQRPQQLALALAATGRRVFYISSDLVDDERDGFEVDALDASGELFQIKLFAKGAPSIYSDAPSLETVSKLKRSIGEVLDWADCRQIVSLVDHPFWYGIASVLPNSRLLYDCMDHHEGFGNNAESLMQLEKQLLSEAELTITTSTWLNDTITPHARHCALIRNAGDYEHFAKVPVSIYRDPQGRRVIGYYGAIAEWFDLDLVEAVARQHRDCSVLLIGADTVNAKSKLVDLNNVTFTGEVPYSVLPHYLHGFDVCLLPFKVIPLTLATNPVKAYEYLGAGKPIVSVALPEMAQFGGLVFVADGKDAFLGAVSKVLSQPEPDALIQQRKALAKGQTWQHRAEVLIQQAESASRDAKVSIVVVTYNNIELTRACLDSLGEYSQYEPLEIIVVDNASSDGSPAFLSKWVASGVNRKLILNEDNRGFAAANNQGLAVASGEYLVMLNNDTYVTPGWIRTLVRHLQRDKTIGLIGPVTNNIGNEAKVDIDYAYMEEMLIKSAAYTRRRIGQAFPLRTVAFFCVMMPRATYERVGTLDEAFGRGFFEDDDYCRRIDQLGLRIVCAEDVFIHHHLSASFNKLKQQEREKLFEANKKIYEAKWGKWVTHRYRAQNSVASKLSEKSENDSKNE